MSVLPPDVSGSWPVVASEDLYRGDWIVALRKDSIRRPDDPDGPAFDRWVFEHPGAVIVLAVDEDERVACVRQYRHPARGTFLELPAGLRDADGEDPLDTAKRELLEEVELEAAEWRQLFSLWPSAGITAERHVFFLARGLSAGDRGDFALEHEEAAMEMLWVPVDDLVEAVLDGRVTEEPISRGRARLRRPASPGQICEGVGHRPAAGAPRHRRAQRPALGTSSPAQLRLRRGRHRRATGRPGPHRPPAAARGWRRGAVLVGLRAVDDGSRGGRCDPRAGGRGVPDDRAVRRPDGVGDDGRRGRGRVGGRAGGLAAGRGGWPPDRRVARGAADVPPAGREVPDPDPQRQRGLGRLGHRRAGPGRAQRRRPRRGRPR